MGRFGGLVSTRVAKRRDGLRARLGGAPAAPPRPLPPRLTDQQLTAVLLEHEIQDARRVVGAICAYAWLRSRTDLRLPGRPMSATVSCSQEQIAVGIGRVCGWQPAPDARTAREARHHTTARWLHALQACGLVDLTVVNDPDGHPCRTDITLLPLAEVPGPRQSAAAAAWLAARLRRARERSPTSSTRTTRFLHARRAFARRPRTERPTPAELSPTATATPCRDHPQRLNGPQQNTRAPGAHDHATTRLPDARRIQHLNQQAAREHERHHELTRRLSDQAHRLTDHDLHQLTTHRRDTLKALFAALRYQSPRSSLAGYVPADRYQLLTELLARHQHARSALNPTTGPPLIAELASELVTLAPACETLHALIGLLEVRVRHLERTVQIASRQHLARAARRSTARRQPAPRTRIAFRLHPDGWGPHHPPDPAQHLPYDRDTDTIALRRRDQLDPAGWPAPASVQRDVAILHAHHTTSPTAAAPWCARTTAAINDRPVLADPDQWLTALRHRRNTRHPTPRP